MTQTRKEVYAVVDGERAYQQDRWGAHGQEHSPLEFLAYMRDYTEEAMHLCSRGSDEDVAYTVLSIVRKVTALGVACMERHGAPPRK